MTAGSDNFWFNEEGGGAGVGVGVKSNNSHKIFTNSFFSSCILFYFVLNKNNKNIATFYIRYFKLNLKIVLLKKKIIKFLTVISPLNIIDRKTFHFLVFIVQGFRDTKKSIIQKIFLKKRVLAVQVK